MTAVEPYRAGEINERQWAHLERQAKVFSKSGLVPKALKGKVDDIMAIALTARGLGLELTLSTLGQFHVIEGKVEPSSQLYVNLAYRAGHEIWPAADNDETQATFYGRRRGSEREISVTFTLEDARRAGLLVQWVEQRIEDGKWPDGNKKYRIEKFVIEREGVEVPEWAQKEIAAGNLRGKDNWRLWPKDMLAARAAKRVCRMVAGDVMLGAPLPPDDETVSEGAWTTSPEAGAGPGTPKRPPGPPPQSFIDAEELAPQSFVSRFPAACEGADMSRPEIAALIAHATGGRTHDVAQVRQGEVAKVRATFAALTASPPTLRFVDVEEGGDVAVAAA